jgi:hypothetical protein
VSGAAKVVFREIVHGCTDVQARGFGNSGSSSEAFKNAISQINDKFNQKRPNVTVSFEALGQGATWTNAQTSRIASQTADVTANFGFALQDIINFQPDTQFLDLSGLPSIQNFDQTNVERFMTWKGKVWQMTLAYVGHVVWTNQDMLDKYSLAHPTTYAEWNSMRDAQIEGRDADFLRREAVHCADTLPRPGRDECRPAEAPELLGRLAGHR